MAKDRHQPIVAIKACPVHRLPMTTIVETGPGISEPDQDLIEKTLMCWRCWESDEDGVRRLLQALGFSPDESLLVRNHAFSKKEGKG